MEKNATKLSYQQYWNYLSLKKFLRFVALFSMLQQHYEMKLQLMKLETTANSSFKSLVFSKRVVNAA
uniref:Uncharacterized protein n=1 Tax=Arundo donax TaxID=35708 RepID=A0A0A9HLF5_ARUDO